MATLTMATLTMATLTMATLTMATLTFGTLKFVPRLRESGIPESQAEAIAEAFRDAPGEAELATKDDIKLAVIMGSR